MWKSNLLKLIYKGHALEVVYRLNAYLNTTGVENLRLIRALKHIRKHLVNRLLTHDSPILTKVHDLPMYIYPNTAETRAYLLRPFEPYTTELYKRAIRPGAVVLDIGAQFGYFSLIAATQAGQEGKIYAFEPVPANFELLNRNIQMNGYTDIIHAAQKAIGDKQTSVTVFVYKYSDSHSMYRHPQASVKETISVECITIDHFLAGQSVDVIKIDIEGNEPYALEGMKQTISKSDSLILFAEIAPAYLRRAGVEPNDYLAQLASLGFDVQVIDDNLHCLKPIKNDFIWEDDPSWYANLYCTRRTTNSIKMNK